MAMVTQTSYGEYTYMGINLKRGVPTEVNNKKVLEYFATLPGFKIEGKTEEPKEPPAEEPGNEGEPPAEEPGNEGDNPPAEEPKTPKGGKKPPLKA